MKDNKAAIEGKSYLEQRLVAAESFAYMMMMNLHKDLFDDGLKLVYEYWQKLITEAPASPSPVQGIKSKEEILKTALEEICNDEGYACQRCEGNGKLWADGKAHLPSHGGAMINCGECGGSGRIYTDLKEIAKAALNEFQRQGISKEGWISVEDWLPKLSIEYNVAWDLEDGDEELVVTTMEFNVKEKKWIDVINGGFDVTKNVKYWRELPKPPGQPQTEQKLLIEDKCRYCGAEVPKGFNICMACHYATK